MRNIFRKLRGSQTLPNSILPPLEDTGERVIPDNSATGFARVNFIRHKVAHLYAIRKIRGARLALDVGCGTGYGSAMVASRMREVVGIDVSEEAIAWARAKHQLDNLEFMTMPATELSFPAASFDAVYSIQTMEHIEDVELHLSKAVRVLRPGGRFVVATLNKLTYSPNERERASHLTTGMGGHREER